MKIIDNKFIRLVLQRIILALSLTKYPKVKRMQNTLKQLTQKIYRINMISISSYLHM